MLVGLEGLLSADNALVIAVMVLGLPKAEQKQAMRFGLGGAFLDAAERAFEQIQAFPESSPISLVPVRAKVLSAFPFSVIYWVTDEVIIVLAVAHHRRRPEYWRGRE